MKEEKRFVKIKDNIESDRIELCAIFADVESRLDALPTGELCGEKGLKLAAMMDAVFYAEELLCQACKKMEEITV